MSGPTKQELERWLQVARDAAAAAGGIIARHAAEGVAEERKADDSPVTIADREAEQAIKEIISAACPGHGFLGEEFGAQQADADFVWLIDPLDGTKSFVRGYPFYSTQIALRHGENIVLGVSAAPQVGETAWATRGGGAFLNGRQIQVSETTEVSQATLSGGNLATLAASPASWSAYGELVQQVHRGRGYGDFYHYHLLASGRIDAVVESDLNILDIAALSLIVEEAGGRFTTLAGHRPGLDVSTALASNGRLHDELLARLGWTGRH
ncbi:MAG: inositol monophosphatase family protein [Gammaproteobacteria bacterium]|nr:inositol monophosphatase family protein [Gammaproteobacteria bacterium]